MNQLKINITRASNGYVRNSEGSLNKRLPRIEGIARRMGAEAEVHKKSGDVEFTLKGKTVGYYFASQEMGYIWTTAKEFASFLKKATAGEFGVSTRKTAASADSDAPKKVSRKAGGRPSKGSDSSSDTKGRKRRVAEDEPEVKAPKGRAKKVEPASDVEPDIDLDAHIDEDASDAANGLAVMKLLLKEMKRVKITSENVKGLADVVNEYLKSAVKAGA